MPRQKWDEINARRSDRYANIGREQESLLEEILLSARDERGVHLFCEVTRTAPNSELDEAGCDFIVKREIQGVVVTRTFGISISARSVRTSRLKHDIPQFHVPIGFNRERIIARVLQLFSSD